MMQHSTYDSPVLQKTARSKKVQTFVVVGLAVFLLSSLLWPLRTSGYISCSAIEFDVLKTPKAVASFHTVLGEAVKRHVSEQAIEVVAKAVDRSIPGCQILRVTRAEGFAERLEVKLAKDKARGLFQVRVSLLGDGTAAEDYLVRHLTTNIGREFLLSPQAAVGTGLIETPELSNIQQRVAESSLLTERAHGILEKLSSTKNARLASSSASPFMNVSHTTHSGDEATRVPVEELRETVDQLSALAKDASEDGGVAFSVRTVQALPMNPVGSVPSSESLLLLLTISTFFGMVTALAYRPFEEKGFASIGSVSSKLGIPVVAAIDGIGKSKPSESKSNKAYWANQVVHFAELTLFGIAVIVMGFCILNPEIRYAFSENLFHGFARIFWLFRT